MVFQILTNGCNNCHGKYGTMNQDMVVGLIIFFLIILSPGRPDSILSGSISFIPVGISPVPLLYLCKSQSCVYIITFPNHPDQNSIFHKFPEL